MPSCIFRQPITDKKEEKHHDSCIKAVKRGLTRQLQPYGHANQGEFSHKNKK